MIELIKFSQDTSNILEFLLTVSGWPQKREEERPRISDPVHGKGV